MPSSWNHRWPLERILFALAGTVTLTSALLPRWQRAASGHADDDLAVIYTTP